MNPATEFVNNLIERQIHGDDQFAGIEWRLAADLKVTSVAIDVLASFGSAYLRVQLERPEAGTDEDASPDLIPERLHYTCYEPLQVLNDLSRRSHVNVMPGGSLTDKEFLKREVF